MRIAVSGSHFTGKTTLIEELVNRLPKHQSIEEPYYLLEEEGYEFPEIPSLEDFEQQLSRSIELIHENSGNVIFDRSPLDFVAYSLSLPDSDSFDLEEWLPKIQDAVKTLDLIVFLPIDSRIPVPKSQDNDFRFDVDEKLRDILIDNSLNLDIEVIEVEGNQERRIEEVLRQVVGSGK